jgi:CRISPR-associated endonuclease/helicase Cas3
VLRFLNPDGTTDDRAKVNLIHGQAMLVKQDLTLRVLGSGDDDEESADHSAPAWFSPKKRALLAPFGVGTVDQAELTVLSARHYMLRLFGLAGKVVIIDEVHAYDTYMSTIIDHALWWLACLGSPVILLSATLPISRHQAMAEAYLKGLGATGELDEFDGQEQEASLPYPVFAAYTTNGRTLLTPVASQPDRPLTLQFVPDLLIDRGATKASPEAEAERLLALVQAGGALCRLCNTVKRAQDIYKALRAINPPDVTLRLLHARFPGDERLERETEITALLGPETGRRPEERIIVVGTQVLEQSLDLDFDVMVSDLAPIDLLLQRAGRLHRHRDRARPAAHQQPILQVTISLDSNGAPIFGPSGYVYEPFILWKTWLVLTERQDEAGRVRLTFPADYRPLIEATYDERLDLPTLDQLHREAFVKAHQKHEKLRADQEHKAKTRITPRPSPRQRITSGRVLNFQEDEDGGQQGWGFASTRDGQPSINIIPLERIDGQLFVKPGEPLLGKNTMSREQELRLLQRAVRVSNHDLVTHLPITREPELKWFAERSLLKFHHPVVLEGGARTIGRTTVRLDPELGLVLSREDEDEEGNP